MSDKALHIHNVEPVTRRDITSRIVDLLDQGFTKSETVEKVRAWLEPWHPEHTTLEEIPRLVEYLAE